MDYYYDFKSRITPSCQVSRQAAMKLFGMVAAIFMLEGCQAYETQSTARPDNILIFTDDQGYADLSIDPPAYRKNCISKTKNFMISIFLLDLFLLR